MNVNGTLIQTNSGAGFECQAPALPGSFTIPASILLAMPAVTGSSPNGNLNVSLSTNPQALTIPGTDYGFVITKTANVSANVAYQ